MRLCPSVPSNIPRVVGPGGIKVINEEIAEDLWVSVPNFTLFRNPKYFDQPHDYIPERWIVDPSAGYTEESVLRGQAAFQPFSVGPRHCIARNLALREMMFALARLFYLFDVQPVGNSGRWFGTLPGVDTQKDHVVMEQWDVFTSLEKGPMVTLRVREGLSL